MLPLRNQNHNEMAFAEEERMMKEAVRSGGGGMHRMSFENGWHREKGAGH